MNTRSLCLTGLLCGVVAAGAVAQVVPARPGRAAGAGAAATPATVSVSARGENARVYLAVNGTNASARATLMDMASKGDIRLLLAPSVRGTFSGTVASKPAEEAIIDVAKLAGLTVSRIAVPASGANSVTPESVGGIAQALSALPAGAVVTDPATGKSATVAASAPSAASGATTILYVQGPNTPGFGRGEGPAGRQPGQGMAGRQPGQGMAGRQPGQGMMGGMGAPPALDASTQALVDRAAQSLQQLPAQQRMDAMRALQQRMFESMSAQDREQMRGRMRPGGFRGPGGNPAP